jgi:hypothetical protein
VQAVVQCAAMRTVATNAVTACVLQLETSRDARSTRRRGGGGTTARRLRSGGGRISGVAGSRGARAVEGGLLRTALLVQRLWW